MEKELGQNPTLPEASEEEKFLSRKDLPDSKITNESQKEKLELNERNLHLYMSKEIEASKLEFTAIKFQSKILVEDAMVEMVEVTDETLESLAKVIKAAHKIDTLNIDCSRCTEITDKGLEYLCESLKGVPLRFISLNFKRCNKITDAGLSLLHDALKGLTSLQELSLSFKEASENKISDFGISKLGEALEGFYSLQRLSLEFIGFSTLTNSGFQSLSEKLSSLSSLQALSLNLRQYEETWSERDDVPRLKTLSKELRKLTGLEDLRLNFSCCKEITDTEMQDLAHSLSHLSSLRNIDLDFSECSLINQEGLQALQQTLEKLTSLQSIRLHFRSCVNIPDVAMDSFGEKISSLSSLKNLDLNFSGYEYKAITPTGMANLAKALDSLSSLERISLIFSHLEITNAEFNQLSQALTKQTLLKDIRFHFNKCNKITLNGFENFCLSFQKLAFLQSLDLEFRNCEQLSDTIMGYIHETLKHLCGSLQSLRLSFAWELNRLTKSRYPHDWNWNGINLYLCDLAQILPQLSHLKNLSLHFPDSSKVCNALSQGLQGLKTLQSFEFGCEEIGDEELLKLTETLKTLPSLQKLGLIAHFYDVSEEYIEKFGQTLSTFANLQHILLRLNMYEGDAEEGLRQTLKALPCLKSLVIEIQDW